MSPIGQELELTEDQIFDLVNTSHRATISRVPLRVFNSDSYGPHMHRTWIFISECNQIVGSIERYWGGLKMICSLFRGSPRTTFFTEDGSRTTNKGLKSLQE